MPRGRLPITLTLAASIGALVLLAVGSVLWVEWSASQRILATLGGRLVDRNVSQIESGIAQHLDPARRAVANLGRRIESGDYGLEDPERLAVLLSGTLAAAPQISLIVVADREGRALRLLREPDSAHPRIERVDPKSLPALEAALVEAAGETEPYWGEVVRNSDAMERAIVAIRWAGTRFDRDDLTNAKGESRRESWLVLGRRDGTRSDLGRSLATARCGACGGPDGGASAACVWCGETLNDGSREWVLLEVVAPGTAAARMLQADLSEFRDEASIPEASTVTAGGLLAWMVAVAASDGRISPRERRSLHRLAHLVGVEPARLSRWIQAALRDELECEHPGPGEASAWCAALEQFARADGPFHPREREVVAKLGSAAERD